MKPFLIILTLPLFLFSCQEKLIKTYHENGSVHEEYSYEGDSLKHGPYIRYAEDGTLLEQSIYEQGYLTGTRKIYSSTGNIEIQEEYKNKKLNGPYYVYHENGKVQLEASYQDDVMAGIVKIYYPSGNIKEEVTFEDSRENGPFTEYHENGNIAWKGTYRNGDNEFGLLEKFDETGKLVRKMMCDSNAICTTTWTIEKEEES